MSGAALTLAQFEVVKAIIGRVARHERLTIIRQGIPRQRAHHWLARRPAWRKLVSEG